MGALAAKLIVQLVPAGASESESGGGGPPPANSVGSVRSLVIKRSLGVPEQMSYAAWGHDAIFLNPGQQPGACQIVEFSLDDGAGIDARMLSTGAAMVNDTVPYVTEQGSSIAVALATARIRRWTAQGITLLDLILGQINTIVSTTGDILAPGGILPDMFGIGYTTVGLEHSQQAGALTFSFSVDDAVADVVLDIDINRDNLLHALTIVMERLADIADPQRAQFVINSGDLGKPPKSITIGTLPEGVAVTFNGSSPIYAPAALLRGSQAQAQTADMVASVSLLGGSTAHGMPDGGSITALRTLNHTLDDATGNFRSGMPVMSVYVNRDQGGVYYWPGDGAFHSMIDQPMGVTDLWYDQDTSRLLAATDAGVYVHASDPGDLAPWTRLGVMGLKIAKVLVDGATTYALATFEKGGSTHVLSWPGSTTGRGYDGWDEQVSQAGITDFVVGKGLLYYFCTANGGEGQIFVHTIGGSGKEDSIPIPNSAVVLGLDAVTTDDKGHEVIGLFVRTSDGARGLYYIDAGAKSLQTAGRGLVDTYGQPVKVNKITQHGAGQVEYTTGVVPVLLWAATNRGVYATANAKGNNWRRTGGQSAMAETEVNWVASAPPRAWFGRTLTRIYAITPSTIWVSHNGAIHWEDALSLPLDEGPAFFQFWKHGIDGFSGSGVYPDNRSTTIPFPGPDGPYELVRELDESTSAPVYTVYNRVSLAPAGAHRDAQISEVSTPALLTEITASVVLVAESARFLKFTADGQLVVDADSMFFDTEDPLRTLFPGDPVSIDATVAVCADDGTVLTYLHLEGVEMRVLEHTITYDDTDPAAAHTLTRCVSILRKDPLTDPNQVAADGEYATSRLALYARQGRR